MISKMNVTHRESYSMFTAHMHFKGKTEWVRGSVHFDTDLIRIHDPFLKQTHESSLEDYTAFEGNMKEYVAHIITTKNEEVLNEQV